MISDVSIPQWSGMDDFLQILCRSNSSGGPPVNKNTTPSKSRWAEGEGAKLPSPSIFALSESYG